MSVRSFDARQQPKRPFRQPGVFGSRQILASAIIAVNRGELGIAP
jgi:hypothetical protein